MTTPFCFLFLASLEFSVKLNSSPKLVRLFRIQVWITQIRDTVRLDREKEQLGSCSECEGVMCTCYGGKSLPFIRIMCCFTVNKPKEYFGLADPLYAIG